MTVNWAKIEAKTGFDGAEKFARDALMPELNNIPVEALDKDGLAKELRAPFTFGFILFLLLLFAFKTTFSPNGVIFEIIEFLMMPVLFLGVMAGMVYLYKDRFIALFMRGQTRFIARAKALTSLAKWQGLHYVPVPGGAPKMLKKLVEWRLMPSEMKQIVGMLDDHGGMDEAVAIANRSGLLIGSEIIVASAERKQKYLKQMAEVRQIEDGFHGERGGVSFDAFEWVESRNDSASIHHLVLVFTGPTRLHGITHLRSEGAGWPAMMNKTALKKVSLGVKQFSDRFNLRSSDQVEARVIFDPAVMERAIDLAHGEKIRAVAFEDHLVFDFPGTDRFALVDMISGQWSEGSIQTTFTNLAEMLDLVDAVAAAFALKQDN